MRVELYGKKSVEENTDKPPVYQRSLLLDSEHRRLFVCNKDVPRDKSACYMRKYAVNEGWIAMDRRIVSILGYDKIKNTIYGVAAANRRSYVRCNITKCLSVAKESWLTIRASQTSILATEIAFVPVTGQVFTDAPISVYNLNDADGNIWAASAVGVHLKLVQSQTWTLKAKWGEKDLNKCYSSPCENSGSCAGDHNNYTCTCKMGWTGRNCDVAESRCLGKPCLNNGTCLDGPRRFTCQCQPGYSGLLCETQVFQIPSGIVYINESCSGTKDDVDEKIVTPNYPEPYSNGKLCTWQIVSNHRVQLNFTYFYTEKNYDKLYVYDGDSASSERIGVYHGIHHGTVVQSKGQNLFLKFKTDSSVRKTGFEISIEAFNEPYVPPEE